jgi:protein OS-9
MLSLLHLLPLPLLLAAFAEAGHPTAPEDLFAFPRYSVSFLNGLPIDNDTAQNWLTYGLKGGLDEFLGRPPPYSIDSGDHPVAKADQTIVSRYCKFKKFPAFH